tara:strand:- start:68 stop:382 length:315 start_codon:yes stop_codon:yes gene_type:complete
VINSSYFNPNSTTDIKYPLITNKAIRLLENNKYTFIVNPKSDKMTIKATIEYLFNVKVIKVNTCHRPRKKKRIGKYTGYKPHYKKAIITLTQSDKINLFENLFE